jgi:PTH1 family peptidyl-tRNA hydrolase
MKGAKDLKIIAGLGNPGTEYEKTRHNVGFMALDALAKKHGVAIWKNKFDAKIGECIIDGEKTLLVKPETYMNLSGEAIGPLLNWYKLDSADLAVIHDDMDIETGTARIRMKGSAGGHNGIKSILSHVGTEDFARFRIGIGRPPKGWTVVDYVLARFNDEDKAKIDETIAKIVVPALECYIKSGVQLAMNRYNLRTKKKKKEEEQTNDNSIIC